MDKRTCIFLLAWFYFCPAALAQPIGIVIGPPIEPPAFGTRMIFPIYFHNEGPGPINFELPDTLAFEMAHQESTQAAAAQRLDPVDAAAALLPGGYIKALYGLELPTPVVGTVRLSTPDLNTPGMIFEVQSTAPTFEGQQPAESLAQIDDLSQQAVDLSVFINAYQPYAKNISFYRPMYFLFGVEPEETRFQISFKYRFFNPETPFSQRHPWIRNFFFGYTQTSFWDLEADSRPFEDTSYKPELFFQTLNIYTGIPWVKGFFVQTGFEHESNGGAGDRSRSTNSMYIEPSLIFLHDTKLTGLRIAPRFRVYVNNNNRTNPDLDEYRGHFDLRLTLGKADSLICDTYFGFAQKGNSVLVDLTYPLHRLLRFNIDTYIQVQYADILGESLLNYTERNHTMRIGLAIVR
jgi:phospholipase A1/A2